MSRDAVRGAAGASVSAAAAQDAVVEASDVVVAEALSWAAEGPAAVAVAVPDVVVVAVPGAAAMDGVERDAVVVASDVAATVGQIVGPVPDEAAVVSVEVGPGSSAAGRDGAAESVASEAPDGSAAVAAVSVRVAVGSDGWSVVVPVAQAVQVADRGLSQPDCYSSGAAHAGPAPVQAGRKRCSAVRWDDKWLTVHSVRKLHRVFPQVLSLRA